jgi:GT2 family glycosyltransferase
MSEAPAVDDLCVVVVCHDDRQWVDEALAAVSRHTGGLALDLVVVDNGSDGAAEHVEAGHPDVRVIRGRGESFGRVKNRALEEASARYVLFLRADMEILEGSFGGLISILDDRPKVALVGGRQLHPDGTLARSIRRFPSSMHMLADALEVERLFGAGRLLGERKLDAGLYDRERACEWTSGFMLVRGAALDKTGWFDERFPFLSEEADLCWRLKRAGWEVIYTPHLTVRRHSGDRRENARLEADAAYARMLFARKHFPRVAAEYRWALALRYALRVGRYSLSRRYEKNRRQAALAALATVLRGRVPLDGRSAV